ncbi:MAG: hypothetical protein LBU91_00235 [Bacteroidales bacterium]|nr:hypothetical protein [Bacteroidales bacterium]
MRVNIHSDTDNVQVQINNDTENWHTLPASVDVLRSKDNLIITAQADTLKKQIEVRRGLSTAFWLGNMFSGAGVIGYIIDLTNPKRFTYPKTIFLNFNNDQKLYSKRSLNTWLQPEKNLLNIKISMPYGNHFYLNRGSDFGGSFGFFGISGGFEYYFSDKYNVNMDFGGLTDFPFPFPASYHPDNYSRSNARYMDIQFGSDFKRFHYDLGIQFNRTSYYEIETLEVFPNFRDVVKYDLVQSNFGFALSSYYRVSKNFNLGINYYPSFLVLGSNPKFQYSHLLFFELSFRIEAHRP